MMREFERLTYSAPHRLEIVRRWAASAALRVILRRMLDYAQENHRGPHCEGGAAETSEPNPHDAHGRRKDWHYIAGEDWTECASRRTGAFGWLRGLQCTEAAMLVLPFRYALTREVAA